jgi:oligoendopeptidase F
MMNYSSLSYQLSRWSLGDLFPAHDSEEMKAAFAEVESKVADFETKRALLNEEIASDDFMALVREVEEINQYISRIGYFAGLWYTEDTQNQDAQNFQAQVDQFGAEIQNRMLFFSLWWKEVDDNSAARLMKDAGDYSYWLEEMRNFKPHTLSEPEEKIINIKDVTGFNAINTIYDTITNRYVFKLTVDGEVKELTRGELMIYVQQHEPELRAAAYQELYRVYGEDGAM